jgi:ABC-type amino acid transport substrate-binding protein
MSDSVGSSPAPPYKKKNSNKFLAIAVGLIVVALLAGYVVGSTAVTNATGTNGNTVTALDKIRDQGKIIMATEATFTPFEFYDLENETYAGFDIDIANRIVENVSIALGVHLTLDVRDVAFSTIPASLLAKQYDMSMSGMTITDERNKTVLFSTPYYLAEAGFGLLVKTGDNSLTSAEDLTSASSIVVNTGTTSELWVQENLIDTGKYPAEKVKSLPTIAACAEDVKIGQSQVFIIDKPTAEDYAANSAGELKVSGVIPSYEPYGVAMNQESTDLKAIADLVINQMYANGEMEALREKWGLN